MASLSSKSDLTKILPITRSSALFYFDGRGLFGGGAPPLVYADPKARPLGLSATTGFFLELISGYHPEFHCFSRLLVI